MSSTSPKKKTAKGSMEMTPGDALGMLSMPPTMASIITDSTPCKSLTKLHKTLSKKRRRREAIPEVTVDSFDVGISKEAVAALNGVIKANEEMMAAQDNLNVKIAELIKHLNDWDLLELV